MSPTQFNLLLSPIVHSQSDKCLKQSNLLATSRLSLDHSCWEMLNVHVQIYALFIYYFDFSISLKLTMFILCWVQ